MLIRSRAWGFIRSGLNNHYGVRPGDLPTGGDHDPLGFGTFTLPGDADVELCAFQTTLPDDPLTIYANGAFVWGEIVSPPDSWTAELWYHRPGEATVLEASGSPFTVTGGAAGITAAGIASAEAFGAPQIKATVGAAGADTGEAFGAPSVRATVALQGIVSQEAFGLPLINFSEDTIYVAGIPSAEAFGDPAVQAQVSLVGIASAEAFGEPLVGEAPPHPIECAGIPSGEAFGRPTIGVANAKTGGRHKRKGNPFLRFDPADEREPESPQPEPAVTKAAPAAPKASGLLLGLIERAIAPAPAPVPAAPKPEPVQPAPAVARAKPAAEVKPAPAPDDPVATRLDALEAVFVARIAELESRVEDLLDTLTLTLQERLPPPPAPGLAIEPEPEPEPLISPKAAAEPAPPPRPTRADIAKENERRARALAKLLL